MYVKCEIKIVTNEFSFLHKAKLHMTNLKYLFTLPLSFHRSVSFFSPEKTSFFFLLHFSLNYYKSRKYNVECGQNLFFCNGYFLLRPRVYKHFYLFHTIAGTGFFFSFYTDEFSFLCVMRILMGMNWQCMNKWKK